MGQMTISVSQSTFTQEDKQVKRAGCFLILLHIKYADCSTVFSDVYSQLGLQRILV